MVQKGIDTSSIEKAVDELMYAYASAIIDSGHSASGDLALNQQKVVEYDGKYFKVSLLLEDYWKYLEEGTQPHFPPINKIKEWIRVKPILPREKDGKLPTQEQLAYMIGRKISKEGTEPTYLLTDLVEKTKFRKRVIKIITDLIKNNAIKDLQYEWKSKGK